MQPIDFEMNDATCPECGGENLTDRPICPTCWKRMGKEMEANNAMGILQDFLRFVAHSAPHPLEYNGLVGRMNAYLLYEHNIREVVQ